MFIYTNTTREDHNRAVLLRPTEFCTFYWTMSTSSSYWTVMRWGSIWSLKTSLYIFEDITRFFTCLTVHNIKKCAGTVWPRSSSGFYHHEETTSASSGKQHTDPWTGIQILEMVCRCYAAGISSTHDSMCRLRLLCHWKTVGWVPLTKR